MANPKSSQRESTRISGFSREAQELTPENLQKLLRYVASTCRIGVHIPRSDWRIFIPWRPFAKKAVGREFPFRSMGFLNVMTYNWMTKTIYRIYKKKHLDAENVHYVPFEESSQCNRLRLETIWNSEVAKRGTDIKLSTVLIRHSLRLFLTALILNLIGGIITLICPTVLFRWLLEYAQSTHTDLVYGFVLVMLVFLSESCRSFLHTGSMFISILCASRLKAGFMAFMYKKILHARGLQGHTIGELVNVFANDSQRLFDLCVHIPAFLVAPFIVVSALIYCTVYIGPWCLVGSAYLLLHFLYQHTISRANSYIRSKTISATDKRVQLTVELVTLIKNIKMNAWEKSFAERITKCREAEESCLRKAAYVQNASVAIIPMVTFFSVVTIFGGYIGSGNSMLPSQAFVIMSVYNLIRTTTSLLPSIIRNWSDFKLGLKRAEGILKMDEVDFTAISSNTNFPNHAIEVEDATFCWMRYETYTFTEGDLDLMFSDDQSLKRFGKSPKESVSSFRISSPPKKLGVYMPILVDIRFNILKGKMVAICGHVGSGKSSLLSGLTGQMKLSKGRVAIQGKIGYVRQQAWIFHGTVRENILFGNTFDERRYRSTIAQCLLAVDLNSLPFGDETVIGERGVNLSEGQKQRVGLARAIYADPDVLLLDDPMSSVDATVCQYLFNNCLKEATRMGKTVLFNTQQIHFLSKCDEVIFLKKGRILRMGSHLALMRSDEEYRSMVTKSLSKIGLTQVVKDGVELLASEEEREIKTVRISSVPSFSEEVDNAELEDDIEEEYLPSKSVNRETYLIYLKAVGGKLICAFVILTFLSTALLIFFSDLWLSNYLRRCDDNTNPRAVTSIACENVSLWIFMVVYLSLALASVVMTGIRGYFFVRASMKASAVIHKKILAKLLKTSISFFEEMPPGKILGTISSGMDGIDVRLPLQLERLVQNMSSVLICVLSVTLTFPKFLIFVAITSVVVYFLQTVSRLVNRQLKIAESLTKSPMYGHLSSTTHGLETIHAFKKMDDYTVRFQTLVDNHVSCLLMIASYTRWIGFRLEMLAIVFTSITAFLVVVTKDQVQISFAGLAIVYASELNSLLRHTIRYLADTEARFTSVERIESFIKNTQEEGPFRIEDTRPPPQWPTKGHIHFENFSLKYGPKHPMVLTNITCDINPQEKIGIIGRTGSGKSSLTVALFRLVEHTQGTITIDDVNIAKIGLYDLRSRMSIVPQDPTLFAGTLRYNLDPMGIYTDEELWKALESCFMKKRVMHLSKKLDTEVIESGGHFSNGERQLFCLARAFLKHSKIMVLDEVASSADLEIDQYLQSTIEESFADCTILTIAHKIKTLVSCSRIMVIENGTIVEYDKPEVLLKSKHSRLNLML